MYLFGKQTGEKLTCEPETERSPHIINNGAAIIDDPSHCDTMGSLGVKDGLDEAEHAELGAKDRV